jgi:hypothetical protein
MRYFLSDPFWYILCLLLGVDYTEWDMECGSTVRESGRDLVDALYVCGYKSLFHLRWAQLRQMAKGVNNV